MAKYINIKNNKTQICGRSPLLINDRHSDAAKNVRYYKYHLLFNYYHPASNPKRKINKPIVEQLPIVVDTSLKDAKPNWLDVASHWIVELFTREKSNQEILSSTA